MAELGIQIDVAKKSDGEAVRSILERTGFFRPCEIVVALEVFDAAADQGPTGDYKSFVAMQSEKVVGWMCFGATPCTEGTFDIYWIAVEPDIQKSGIGSKLMKFAEDEIEQSGGRLIIVETSGNERYKPTRRFYENLDYKVGAVVDDFYAPGDSKYIFTKEVKDRI